MSAANPVKNTEQLEIDWNQWIQEASSLLAWRDSIPGRSLTVVLQPEHASCASQFDELKYVDRIVVEIGKFTDGRVFGIGRHLRQHVDFQGQLEARGDYLPDQLAFLERCGFDWFNGVEADSSARAGFTNHYQGEESIRSLRNAAR